VNDVALRRRIATLVVAAILAMSGAVVMAGSFAANDAVAIGWDGTITD
jgi:hypothetical protein